jgi:hypothetical protein
MWHLARSWSDELINDHKEFNDWILNNAETAFNPSMPLINTSATSPSEVAGKIKVI